MNFEKVPFRLEEVAKHTVDLFKAKADERKLELIINIEQKIPSTLCGDPTRLSQILNNLVGNAIKLQKKETYPLVSRYEANAIKMSRLISK